MGFHPQWSEMLAWVEKSQKVFIKKLSRNDCAWADSRENGHQNGPYIPRSVAESDFFPVLSSNNPKKPHVFDVKYPTFWLASGEISLSNIKYYSVRNPGKPNQMARYEWQHTGVPKEQFQELSPASILLVGKLSSPEKQFGYWFVVVDSASHEAQEVETYFNLESDFHYGLFDPHDYRPSLDSVDAFIAILAEAMREGKLDDLIRKQTLPPPEQLALQAQQKWMDENGRKDLDPFNMKCPGDVVMSISRDIEYSIYRQAELRLCAARAAKIVLEGKDDPVARLVRGLPALDSIFLSASQTRKSRAGLSFEHHVGRLLRDGRIKYAAQMVIGSRRPDFVLPGDQEGNDGDSLILSLKTTLRERWKQLSKEKAFGPIYLATVDDRISSEAVAEMASTDICLVVPESLKTSKESVYSSYGNVITFRDFFDDVVRRKRPSLIMTQAH